MGPVKVKAHSRKKPKRKPGAKVTPKKKAVTKRAKTKKIAQTKLF